MVYISCSSNFYTGGPTLAHQLCFVLNQYNIKASMFYYGAKKGEDPVHQNYKKFNNPYVTELDVNTEDTLVILETKTFLVNMYPRAKKIIWWMSVDNLFVSKLSYLKRLAKKIGLPYLNVEKERNSFYKKYPELVNDTTIYHLYQSEYAKLFLIQNGVKEDHVLSLTDYVEDEVFEYAESHSNLERENVILYNPKKGLEFTKKIIEYCQDIPVRFVPLINMKKSEVSQCLCSSKLYIDFGTHPGKDRFPREAVICGCCIITGKRGSANNSVDIQIPDNYKYEDLVENLERIKKQIIFVINDYATASLDFRAYKQKIYAERDAFTKEAVAIFSKYK